MSDTHLSEVAFDSLDLHPDLQASIRDTGFTHCTPIQAQTLPIALTGKDVAGQAQTGTGKTAAFLVAAFQNLLTQRTGPGDAQQDPRRARHHDRADARTGRADPQRRRGARPAHRAEDLGLVFGGVDYEKQRRELEEGVDVLIGTPGGSSTTSSSTCSTCAARRCSCSTKPTACSTSASSPTSATCCAGCRPPRSASRCCSRPRCRSACWSSPTST
jgi:hypothetical protein